jgi:tetratricopeptide (TPR) repeat protein
MRLTADDLHARGVALSNRGRMASARRILRLAAERATTSDEKARIAGSLAVVLTRTGHPEEAERICRDALSLSGNEADALSSASVALLHGQLGVLAVHRGDFAAAIPSLGRAIREETDADRLGNLLVTRSVALMRQSRLKEAREDLSRAAERYAAASQTYSRAIAIHNSGYVALLEGELVTALERMLEARPIVASSPVNAAVCDQDRAEVLREAGQVFEAERTLESVARSFGAARMPQSRAEAEYHLARSLLTHRPERAAEVAAAAARRFRGLGSAGWAARADGLRLRALLTMTDARRRRPTGAEVEQAVAALERAGFPTEAQLLRLQKLIARARRGDIDRGGIRLRPNDPQQVRLLVHEARAVRAAAKGRDGDARRHAAEGLESLASWQRSFGALDVASSIAMHGNGLMFEGLAAAIRSRRPDVLFEWSERARHFAHQVTPVRPPRDPEHAADLAQLRLLREEVGIASDADPRVREVRERIRRRQWATAGDTETVPRVDLETLRGGLDSDSAMLTFVYSRDTLVCLAVPASGAPRIVLIDWSSVRARMTGLRADLDVVAAMGGGPMGHIVARTLEARLADLSRLLLEDALAAAGDPRRVLITAPGILAGLPWTMLPAMRGRSMTLARSASRWIASRDVDRDARTAGFAVGPGVARGEDEAMSAAFAWEVARNGDAADVPGPKILQGQAAQVSAVAALAEQVDVLHLIAHGRHAPDAPMLSGVSLADGTLFGYDIDLIAAPPKTVILSACELGRSSVRWGAEAMSMAHAWLHAGAVCVIAAPVTVADDVAAELLAALHSGLAAGFAPSDALSLASQETGLVAPFVVHGSGF